MDPVSGSQQVRIVIFHSNYTTIRYSKLSCRQPSANSRITALAFVDADENGSGVLVIATYDRASRLQWLDLVDVHSQTHVSCVSNSHHFHKHEISQILHVSGTMLTASRDCVISWTYINNFDIGHRLKEPVDCMKIRSHFRAKNSALIESVCQSEDLVCVLLKNLSVLLLSLPDLTPIGEIGPNDKSVPTNISLFSDLLLVSSPSLVEIFDVSAPAEVARIGHFSSMKKRIVSAYLFNADTMVVLCETGHIDIVDVASNTVIGSTACPGGSSVSISSFVVSADKLICVGNKSNVFEVLRSQALIDRFSELRQSLCGSEPLHFFDSACDTMDVGHVALKSANTAAPRVPGQKPSPNDVPSMHIPVESEFTWANRIAKYRQFLHLPLNEKAFDFLTSYSQREYEDNILFWKNVLLGDDDGRDGVVYVVKSERSINRLIKALSVLTCWNRDFKNASGLLPKLVFPFVKLFGNSQIFLFELTAFFISNFCSNWFDFCVDAVGGRTTYYPVGIVSDIEALLDEWDAELYTHLSSLLRGPGATGGVGVFLYEHAFASLFTEILPGADWQRLLDLLVFWFHGNSKRSFDPTVLTKIFVNYLIFRKNQLINIKSVEELGGWFSAPHDVRSGDIEALFKQLHTSCIDKEKMKPFYLPENCASYPDFPDKVVLIHP